MKFELKPSPKLKNKTTILYTVTSLLAVLTVGCFAFFYFNLGVDHTVYAASGDIIRSAQSGKWNDPGTWDKTSPERIPEYGDRVIIESGDEITIDEDTDFNGEIIVNGELRVEYAQLTMDENSKIAVNEGGKIRFSPYQWYGRTGFITIGNVVPFLGWLYWGDGTMIEAPATGPVAFGAGADELLPIDLVTFNATLTPEKQTKVNWTTASEENNDYFTIERSLDGQNFFTIDTIDGAGNSKELKEYSYTDNAPVSGYNYYRLTQTDFDGKSETFDIATVFNDNAEPELSIVSIGPNPYRDHFEINFTSLDNSSVHMKISDMKGRTIFFKSLEAEKGLNSFTYVDQKNLEPGIYLFTIVQRGTPAKTYRIVKDS